MAAEVDAETDTTSWESRIGDLLDNLSTVQSDLLGLLEEKRVALAEGAYDKLDRFTKREAELVHRLEECQVRRHDLLESAAREGLPASSVESLTQALPASQRGNLTQNVDDARHQSRLLQHHSLTNWVVTQRTLLHLSQMVEIIATGGRMRPTYGSEANSNESGALVDRSA